MVDGRSNSIIASTQKPMPRRRFLQLLAAGTVATAALPKMARATPVVPSFFARDIAFQNTHTGESVSLTYFEHGQYLTEALQEIDNVFRDHRTGEIYPIDPNLLNLLYDLQDTLQVSNKPFSIISGYRSPFSNSMLHEQSSGVAKNSFHMQGRAVDIRIEGVDTRDIRDAAMSLQQGGVGYYASSDFVHVDTGMIRYW
jgi:uncharacterized protein YcbK (DUF882 family)